MSTISSKPRAVAAISAMLALGAALVAAPGAVATPPPGWEVVAQGLDNPRQLSFTGNTLYVAEAGKGGT